MYTHLCVYVYMYICIRKYHIYCILHAQIYTSMYLYGSLNNVYTKRKKEESQSLSHTENSNLNSFDQIELPAKLLDYVLRNDKSNNNQYTLVIHTGKLQPVLIWREKPVLLSLLSNLGIPVPASYPVFRTKWREIS